MGSFSGLGIGLSFVFGCILMGLVAELYYLLWWKKRISYNSSTNPEIEESCFVFSWKKPKNPEEEAAVDPEMGSTKESLGLGLEGIESEIMRMHNLCGPPRFLFTIKEESREDLESEDGKSRRGSTKMSLSDFLLSSPTLKAHNDHHGFNNPLFEAEVNRFRSSPPPKFKFLKDAEDKLIRKLLVQEAENNKRVGVEDSNCGIKDSQEDDEKINDVSFLRFS
ncbi:hypothetical protein PHJA_000377600 [Phtheirospermum japonicum]|uniref:Uncharacterized protein n=1 Tax=Phtheirospermum japonicum TaxID=374723 RepID=A0A830BEE5_9LAMI|nr:hypothetical protein PHJA_000377600 [Phtheirospermum japonicum]